MPALYEIRWLPDGRTQKFAGSRGNYYEFSASDRLDLHSLPVWCHRCAKITHGEHLSTVELIDKQIRDVNDPASEDYRVYRVLALELRNGEAFLRQQLTELERRRRWRASRNSPAKCIRCGSTDIVLLSTGTPIPNPGGAGQLQIDCIGMCSTDFNEWFFTPEGDRIPRDTRPTYWRHLELDKPQHRKRFQAWLRSLPKRRTSAEGEPKTA